MKVMVMVKAAPSSEAGKMPGPELLTAMGQFNESLVQAGIMESGDGLKPSSEGVRVHFSGADRTVTRGPFAETSELLAGYWVWQVDSMDDAIAWVKKCPNPMEEDSTIEIRPFFELEDFAEADPSGDMRAHETQLRNTIATRDATVTTYLFFGGQAEEALAYYQQHLGAKVITMLRFNESPQPIPEEMLPKGFDNKIMHAAFNIGQQTLFASDGNDENRNHTGFSLTLTLQAKADAERIFTALADGGHVKMPLAETFWSPLYGQVTDKFGIDWMIMLPAAAS